MAEHHTVGACNKTIFKWTHFRWRIEKRIISCNVFTWLKKPASHIRKLIHESSNLLRVKNVEWGLTQVEFDLLQLPVLVVVQPFEACHPQALRWVIWSWYSNNRYGVPGWHSNRGSSGQRLCACVCPCMRAGECARIDDSNGIESVSAPRASGDWIASEHNEPAYSTQRQTPPPHPSTSQHRLRGHSRITQFAPLTLLATPSSGWYW